MTNYVPVIENDVEIPERTRAARQGEMKYPSLLQLTPATETGNGGLKGPSIWLPEDAKKVSGYLSQVGRRANMVFTSRGEARTVDGVVVKGTRVWRLAGVPKPPVPRQRKAKPAQAPAEQGTQVDLPQPPVEAQAA